jgi:hypothetical protein
LIQWDPDLRSANYSHGLSPEDHIDVLIGRLDDVNQTITLKGQNIGVKKFLNFHKNRETIKHLLMRIEDMEKENKKMKEYNKRIKDNFEKVDKMLSKM